MWATKFPHAYWAETPVVEKLTLNVIGRWARLCTGRRFKFIQQTMALCIPVVSELHDYAKVAILLEHSNSFPWIKELCPNSPDPSRVGSGNVTKPSIKCW